TTYQLMFGEGIRDLNGDALADNTPVTFTTAQLPEAIAFTLAGGPMFMIDANGENLVSLGIGSSPAWLPGGNLVFVRPDCTECPGELWARARDGTTTLLLGEGDDRRGFRDPAPTRNGSRIAMVWYGAPSIPWTSWAHPSSELIILTVSDRSVYRVP